MTDDTLVNRSETVLKETTSRCLVCLKQKPAQVIKVVEGDSEKIIMRRVCACHGTQDTVIASDARFYWLAQGNPLNRDCGCGSSCSSAGQGGKEGSLGKNALDEAKKGTMDKLSTCLALIEIVDSCNLACPTCFADSPIGVSAAKIKYRTFDDLTGRIQKTVDAKGHIEVLQLSGGEPTIHPDFFRLIEWIRTNPGIDYLLINTNGVRLAKDPAFVEEFGRLVKSYGNIQLYLQFDGPQESGQVELRGLDLREVRKTVIRNCEKIGLPITLAMTVNEDNLPHLWDTVAFALPHDIIRGVSFQPMFLSGRNPLVTKASQSAGSLIQPITTADVILGLAKQSVGDLSTDDFTPLPCGDPNCATIGWLFRMGGKFYSPSEFGVDIPALQKALPDRVNYNIEDLRKCGCEDTQLGDLMKRLELRESNAFRLFIKPFMDERTWDEDRIDRCCTHVIRPDGELDSFCRYYFPKTVESVSCC